MSTQSSPERGVLYFAKGEKFVEEAIISAQRTKSVMPDCPITLIADREVTASCFDSTFLDATPFEKRNKPQAMQRTPYDRTLYLDTDIYLENPVGELFDILDDFGIAVGLDREIAHIPTDGNTSASGVPPGVPEFNTGVISYRKTPPVMKLLADWESRCLPEHDFDQRTFRPALYHSDVRVCPLQNRYNCMFHLDGAVEDDVKVFHGPLIGRDRNKVDIDEARDVLNATDGFRTHRQYMGSVVINPSLPITMRVSTFVHHLRDVYSEQGARGLLEMFFDMYRADG